MPSFMFAPLGALLLAVAAAAAPAPFPERSSVQDVVEFTHIVQPSNPAPDAIQQQVSPDGAKGFIVTRRANVATDRNHYEIQLLHISPERLADRRAPQPEVVFAFDAEHDASFLDPAIQQVRWLDHRTLVFMARLDGEYHQVYRLDLPTRELRVLTRETTPIVSFAASSDLRRIVYAVQVSNPPMPEGAHGIVIGNQKFWTVKSGLQRLAGQVRKYRYVVADVGSSQPPRALGAPFFESNFAKPKVSISPDGRWALLPRYEPSSRTLAWSRSYPMLGELAKDYGALLRADPLSYFSNPHTFAARRMTAWRLDDAREQTVVDAPDDSMPGSFQYRDDLLWQGNGASVIVAGTHLPVGADGASPSASYVIEYWPDQDKWSVVARLAGRATGARALDEGFEVVDNGKPRRFRRAAAGVWREDVGGVPAPGSSTGSWSLRIAQALNVPPDVVATGPSGQTVRMTSLNPQFDSKMWGTVTAYRWRDAKGRAWSGGILEGSDTAGQGKLPLVIQAYAFAPDRFFLDGPNHFSGGTSAFPGRAFVREGVLVLAMGTRPETGIVTDDFRKLRVFNEGVRGAVNALVKAGRVDPAKVGIIGWSTTGERVLNLVTFSDLPIRAATMADGDANTMFAYTVTYGFGVWDNIEAMNRGEPFGPRLSDWVRNDPALNTDCVRAALRIESYGVPVYNNYDIYALLRRQYKPVEMVLIPGGSHSLSTPSERMLSLQGNLDWYRFWLKGEVRTEPVFAGESVSSLQKQYDAWREMAGMKSAIDRKPRCARSSSLG